MMVLSTPSETRELKIRPMTLADVPRVRQIDVASFSLPWPEKSYIFELTENPTTLALVAELAAPGETPAIVGMSVVWVVIDEAHIATIAIHPGFRGLSYGKKLLAETLRYSIQRGATQALLEVRAGNAIAQQMYHSFGFKIVGRRARYYHDNNEDAVLMSVNQLGPEYLAWLDKFAC